MILTNYYSINELKDIRNSIKENAKIPWATQMIYVKRQRLLHTDNNLKNTFKLSPLQFCKVFDYYLEHGYFKVCKNCSNENYNFRLTKLEWLDGCSKECQSIMGHNKRDNTML